jgi:hypothetical protein
MVSVIRITNKLNCKRSSLNEHKVVVREFLAESSKAAMIAKDSGDYTQILVNLAKRFFYRGK